MQRTLVLLKPDALKRNLVNQIIARLDSSFCMRQAKLITMDTKLAEDHYGHLRHLDNFRQIIDFMISGQMIAAIYEGEQVIAGVRKMTGPVFGATSGTIRGDFGAKGHENLIHASDSEENAEIEIRRFFPERY